MNIKRVIVHGFKSYDDTVVFGPFSPGTNALVGLNGTGKSNFYSAISFVLLDEYAHIRISDRKALLHEGQGQNAMTAYVEIVFDNKNRIISIDNDEVSIRRSIGLKKDEYFIDRKNSTRQDVHNLLESCGFSPSSGYYIVRQGKVSSLAMMKDSDRLELLMEIAGTKFYDQQRDDSLKLIAESHGRIEKIKESLEYIDDRLKQLEDEKKELEENEKLEREKRAIEFLIQRREISSIEDELQEKEAEREIENNSAETYKEDFERVHNEIKEKQNELQDLKSTEKILISDKEKLELRKNNAIRSQTRAEFKFNQLQEKLENSDRLKNELQMKLDKVEQSIASTNNEYEAVNSEFTEVANKKASVDGELEGLQQVIGGKIKDPTSTQSELSRAKSIFNTLEREAHSLHTEIEQIQEKLGNYDAQKSKLINDINECKQQQIKAKENQNICMNKRKELWKKEDRLKRESKKVQQQIEKYHQKLSRVMPPDVSQAITSIKELNQEGVYSPIYDLITCDEELLTAINVVAKSRLYNIVVENDEIADSLIKFLLKNEFGRISFLSLNILKQMDFEPPEGVVTLISKLNYDEKFEPAIYKVFGKTALANNLREATEIAARYNISCVTLEGDFVSANGPMTGGSRTQKKSPLSISNYLEKKEEKGRRLKEEINEAQAELKEIDKELQYYNNQLNELKYKKLDLEGEKNKLISMIGFTNDEYETKIKQRDERNQRKSIKIEHQLQESQKEKEESTELYNEISRNIEEIEEKHQQINVDITELEENIIKLKKVEERTNKMINTHKKALERITGRISLLHQRQEETIQQQRDIGTIPENEIKEIEELRTSELLRQLSIVNENSKRYRHVNKKAIEQHRSFSTQQNELQKRQEELIQSEDAITSLIAKLDQRKDEAIASTFSQLSTNFSKVFSELEPTAQAQLVLQRDEESGFYTGIAIHVQFNTENEVSTLDQLSGGQKTLVALSLVFAIQKFSPAPFYLFDEVDSALDDKYRKTVSEMIHKLSHPDEGNGAQIIFTTFKKELLEECDKYFGIKMTRGHSTVLAITQEEAERIISEEV
ncbi:RecF/RecN/SMC protein [Histomonas meleagridis]|uniref:RecF/RecN/SMC protein n=1 Tax=Histomonas meleagridis TaxID=135588 RepID=UPI003559CA6E|nr:RecF/RecN/SMC protein [Histomonas meleagridis]